jgi:hypothetical protein
MCIHTMSTWFWHKTGYDRSGTYQLRQEVCQVEYPRRKGNGVCHRAIVTAKSVANCVKVNQLDASQGSEVPVVNEFPDVLPEELPGMPPDRDIKFVIELKPGTTPIYDSL